MKKTSIIIFGVLLLAVFLIQPCSALETQYPEITTIDGQKITITDESTPDQYVVYMFYVLVSLGAIIAFIVLVMAGFNFLNSGGIPTKISSARNQALGAFVGLIVLFSCHLILNTVNKSLVNTPIKAIECKDVPICVTVTKIINEKAKTTLEMSIPMANDNLVLQEGESIVITKYDGLKEIWGFVESGFKGSPIKLFPDPANPEAEVKDLALSPTVDGTKLKSYKIIEKREGIYLYDKPNFEVGDGSISPFFLTGSVNDFSKTNPNFFHKTQSVQIIAPRFTIADPENHVGFLGTTPGAVFFSEPEFRGTCLEFFPTGGTGTGFSDLNQEGQLGKPLIPFGYNVSSAIAFKYTTTGSTEVSGTVTFYNTLNCQKNESDPEQKSCEQEIYENPWGIYLDSACGQDFKIKSFKINGPVGVVLVEGNKCQYFDKKDFCSGNCVCSILETSVSNPDIFEFLPID
ncbi:MAG: hypothetical protein WC427_00895 [Candidatus Paceibacterota bacterium]